MERSNTEGDESVSSASRSVDSDNAPVRRPLSCSWIQTPLDYLLVLQRNKGYRLYLISHICQDVGDWFVKIGALLTVQRFASSSGSAISYLMLTIMLPQVFLSPVGGILADSFDRRKLMIGLDFLACAVVFGYLLALKMESVPVLYAVSTLRTAISSLYDPITRSILPLIVIDPEDLKRAVSINYIAWSAMRILGGLVAGYSSAYVGVGVCFLVDGATYFVSAIVMMLLKGEYSVVKPRDGENGRCQCASFGACVVGMFKPVGTFARLIHDLLKYLLSSRFGLLVFLRATGAAVWGWADVLNVAYTHVENDEEATSRRLGILMAFLGAGCLVGPVLANFHTDPNRPITLQIVCISSIAIMTSAWVGISLSRTFWLICAFSALRTLGAAILITNSTLLLQCVSAKEMLGRILAFEFAFSMGVDSLANYIAGMLQDRGLSIEHIGMVAAAVGAVFGCLWTLYHVLGGGLVKQGRVDDGIFRLVDNVEAVEEYAGTMPPADSAMRIRTAVEA